MAVLVVDDCNTTRQSLRTLLESQGYPDVLGAASGEEALGLLGEVGPPVDAVLLDVELPGMDGIETCRRIKAAPHNRDLPVLVVTGSAREEVLEAAFAAGATDFLAKPLRVPELLARLHAALRLKRELD
ncbi:MAG: response regulator, partial [Gemmataceae bacterium]|nr:response regulator [Gemmataceae bacterium]